MNETRDLLERVGGQFAFPDEAFERLLGRRDRRQRNRRIAAFAVVVVLLTAASVGAAAVLRSEGSVPMHEPPGSAHNGLMVFVAPGSSDPINTLYVAAQDGSGLRRLVTQNAEYPDWAPDGSTIAYDNGTIVNFPDWIGQQGHVFTVRPDGTGVTEVTSGDGAEFTPEWSPDGAHLVVTAIEPGQPPGIAIVDPATGAMQPITSNPYPGHLDKEPSYSPDGSQVVFVRERELVDTGDPVNRAALFIVNVDGSGLRRLTSWRTSLVGTPSWSPDGQTIVFRSAGSASAPDAAPQIYTVGADGTGLRQLTSGGRNRSFWPSWSPDGHLIVFTRYVTVFPGKQLFTMWPDGSHVTLVPLPTNTEWNEADWGTHP